MGDIIAHAGTVIDAGVIASLLSTGVTSVEAYDRPTVAVISAGDELVASVDSVDQLRPGTIPDSNRPMLAELLREQGVAKVRSVVVDDDAATFRKQLDALSRECDLVVTSGGVSAGAFDVVKEALTNPAASGATDMWFGPVQIQPGKPQGLGRVNGTPVICLPGNPVSSFVCFYLLSCRWSGSYQAFPRRLRRSRLGSCCPPTITSRRPRVGTCSFPAQSIGQRVMYTRSFPAAWGRISSRRWWGFPPSFTCRWTMGKPSPATWYP